MTHYEKDANMCQSTKGPGKSTAILSAFCNRLSAFSVVPAGGRWQKAAESGKYVGVSRKCSCYFTLTRLQTPIILVV